MAFIWASTPVVTSPPSRVKTLVRYRRRTLFLQVNSDLDDIFLDARPRPFTPKQRFMIAWSYYRTLVSLTSASVNGKQLERGDGFNGYELYRLRTWSRLVIAREIPFRFRLEGPAVPPGGDGCQTELLPAGLGRCCADSGHAWIACWRG